MYTFVNSGKESLRKKMLYYRHLSIRFITCLDSDGAVFPVNVSIVRVSVTGSSSINPHVLVYTKRTQRYITK